MLSLGAEKRLSQLRVLWCFKHHAINTTVVVSLGAAGKFVKLVMKLGTTTIALNEFHHLQPLQGNITRQHTSLELFHAFLPIAIINHEI